MFLSTGLHLDKQEATKVCAAYEMFSGCTLEMLSDGFCWSLPPPVVPPHSDEIAELRREIERLRLSQMPITEDTLTADLTAHTVAGLRSLGPKAQWMRDALGIFEAAVEDISEDSAQRHLVDLWRLLVRTHFSYGRSFPSPLDNPVPTNQASSSSSSASGRTRPAPFSVTDALRKGGRVEEAQTAHGIQTFIWYEGEKYYKSKDGTLWNSAQPPPKRCFRCNAQHWHWDCPAQK